MFFLRNTSKLLKKYQFFKVKYNFKTNSKSQVTIPPQLHNMCLI